MFNLTLPGEHPHCGTGLVKSGFPYDPEELMAQGGTPDLYKNAESEIVFEMI